jgi:hypothetical protein
VRFFRVTERMSNKIPSACAQKVAALSAKKLTASNAGATGHRRRAAPAIPDKQRSFRSLRTPARVRLIKCPVILLLRARFAHCMQESEMQPIQESAEARLLLLLAQ